jgi:hypothetical protein
MTAAIQHYLDSPWLIVAAVLVVVFGVGRLSRVLTYDVFPPSIAVRIWWDKITHDGSWSKLVHCFWCATPWIMLVALGWFALGLVVVWVAVIWWLFWGWLALAYVSSIIIARDEPGSE